MSITWTSCIILMDSIYAKSFIIGQILDIVRCAEIGRTTFFVTQLGHRNQIALAKESGFLHNAALNDVCDVLSPHLLSVVKQHLEPLA